MPTTIQPSFGKGEIAPALYGRVDTQAYQSAVRKARNCIIHAYGGISNRPGTEHIAPVKDHANPPWYIKFQFKTTDVYLLEFGHQYMRVIRDDGHVLETAKVITGVLQTNPGVVTAVAHGFTAGQEVYIDGIVGMTRLNGRRFRVGTTTPDTFQLLDQVDGSLVSTSGYDAYISGGTVARVYEIATPYAVADLPELKYEQSADVMRLTHKSYAVQKLTRTGHAAWTIGNETFAPAIAAPGSPAATPGAAGTISFRYVITASTASEEESLASAEATCTAATPTEAAPNQVSWAVVGSAASYNVYKFKGGSFGFIGRAISNSFKDVNIEPDFDFSPPEARDPFNGAGKYPGAIGFFEQRLAMGGSLDNPDTVEYSQTGNHKNFSRSTPVQDDDSITATLASREVNEIRHLVGANDMLTFTSGSEWKSNSGADAAFSPSSIKQKPQSIWGSSHRRPITAGNTVLFVEANNVRIRSFGFSLQIDGYTGSDMNLLASHMFGETKQIVDWYYARTPDPIVYCVKSDGGMACMTFQQEQEVIAWTTWDTHGQYKRVCVLPPAVGTSEDRTYVLARRKLAGRWVHHLERVRSRAFEDVRDCYFVDDGLSLDNPVTITGVTSANPVVVTAPSHGFTNGQSVDPFGIVWEKTIDQYGGDVDPNHLNGKRYVVANATTDTFELSGVDGSEFEAYVSGGVVRRAVTTVSGLDHLGEGTPVAVLADGSVIDGITVEDGAITLPSAASRIHVGLRYIAEVETLNIESPGAGTIQGKLKRVVECTVRFLKSRGLFIGATTALMEGLKQRENENYNEPTRLKTGDQLVKMPAEYNANGRIFMRQPYPLPMTILAVVPKLVMEDGETRGE